MPDPVTAGIAVGGQLLGGYLGSEAQSSAASSAASGQVQAAQLGIEEQRRQFDAIRELLAPYVSAGTGALTAQQELLGLQGPQAQQAAIQALQQSPQFTAMTQQGENAILQNAAATGDLRGGNTAGALAQFRPQVLSQLIGQQFQNLGGLTSLGQNAAVGTGNAGMQTGSNIANLLGQQGAAQAGAALARGQSQANFYGAIGQLPGQIATLGALGVF